MQDNTTTHSDSTIELQAAKWKRRRDIPLSILAWIALLAVIFWAASHVIHTILILAIAALLAYALAPVVKLLQKWMPRPLAILIVYLLFLAIIGFLFYQVARAAIHQSAGVTHEIAAFLNPSPNGAPASLGQILGHFGIPPNQIANVRQQLLTAGKDFVQSAIPVLRGVANFAIDTLVVAILSIYLLLDGSRAVAWIRRNSPLIAPAEFLLDTLQRIVGGYIRGQITLAALIGILVGLGMGLIFHLPFAIFLGALAFIMAFIPVLGTFISGAVCVLIGFTQGWPIALGVLIYFVIIHIIEGEVVGPRIVGQAVGLHPIVSLCALLAGAELFGVWGALFASPIAGVLQALIIALWTNWKTNHPEQFRKPQEQTTDTAETA
jgi:predicted PurR-regulated permease PerM